MSLQPAMGVKRKETTSGMHRARRGAAWRYCGEALGDTAVLCLAVNAG
jgi:hypothetical protein